MRSHQVAAVLWLTCMIAHASNFWKWMLLPVSLLVTERIFFLILLIANRTVVKTAVVHDNVSGDLRLSIYYA